MSDDLISRQAAIENSFEVYTKEYGWCEVVGVDAISELPPAQPEIIRCKDCKYSDENWRRVSVKWLPCMDIRVPSNWFCGSAERREGCD